MDKWILNTLRFSLLVGILYSHNNDGNIWGIWIEDSVLKVGDFWGSLTVIYLIYALLKELKDYFNKAVTS